MTPVGVLAYRSLLVLILGFVVITLWKVFTQQISLKGLLQDNEGNFSPGRAQMLMITLVTALQYVMQVIQKPTGFPELPNIWLAALGASHGVYLGGKAYTIFSGNRTNQS